MLQPVMQGGKANTRQMWTMFMQWALQSVKATSRVTFSTTLAAGCHAGRVLGHTEQPIMGQTG